MSHDELTSLIYAALHAAFVDLEAAGVAALMTSEAPVLTRPGSTVPRLTLGAVARIAARADSGRTP